MADVHDYLEASRATDEALRQLAHSAQLLGEGLSSDDSNLDVANAVLLAGQAVALAIREAATRADYVARDRR